MLARLVQIIRDCSGVTAIEYGLIAALVGVAIIAGVQLLGSTVNEVFVDTNTQLETATSPAPAPAP